MLDSIYSDDIDSVIDDSANPDLSFPFLKDLNLDDDVIRRLSIHLSGIIKGDNRILTTPIVNDHPPEDILKDVDNMFEANKYRINSPLIELEYSNRSKFGPRSIALPWKERLDGVRNYFKDSSSSKALSVTPHIMAKLRSANLRPLSPEKAILFLKNSTNSGLPFYCRKSKIKDRLLDKYKDLLEREDPCILFTRTQESGKTRSVWGFPVADTLREMRFYRPLLDFQKKQYWRAAIRSPLEVDLGVTKVLDFAKYRGLTIGSLDFSNFDQSVKSALQKPSFDYIKSCYQGNFHPEIDEIYRRFNTIGIVTPSGIFSGSHGVPSGSTFTNEVDSIAQYLIAHDYPDIYLEALQIQGDDGLYAVKRHKSDDFLDHFKGYGLDPNKFKSVFSNDYGIYLQCLYHPDYRNSDNYIGGIYPIYRALNRLIYQERWSNFEDYGLTGKDFYSIRAISILENCKWHPLFKDFVKIICKYDKYSLEFTQKGLTNYTKYVNESPGIGGFLNNQYGDNVGGIRSFESYKLIKEIARY